MERNTEMINSNEQLEKEVYELMGSSSIENSRIAINALEAACLILDNKFGKDFHKKNPKLAIRFAESIMKNIRMTHYKDAVQNGMNEHLDSIKEAMLLKDYKTKETMFEDYADSFRF